MDPDEQWTRTWEKDRIVALCRDPQTIFVYWEMTDWRKRVIAQHFGQPFDRLGLSLRAYDVTDIYFTGENAHWDRLQAIAPETDSAYMYGLAAHRVFVVDIGLQLSDGHFFTLLRSEPVATPPQVASVDTGAVRFGPIGVVTSEVAAASGSADLRTGSQIPYEDSFDGYSVSERPVN
ncbi:MAG: DUF4912 domain-containing protein [Firmicutes bacterium]|nr:DUF4912 domain-containing protein [Bacillota bacterium]